jgi:hypothetical protein
MVRVRINVLTQSLHLGLLLMVSLICCLPRAPENASLFGQAPALASWQSATAHQAHAKADLLLLHVRKFRRRKMAFFFRVHVTSAYLPSPLRRITACFTRSASLLADCPPDPLIHPPA